MNRIPRILINILMLVVLALSGLLPAAAKPPIDAVEPTPSSSLLFIENAGQFAEGARFQVLGTSQGTVWLAQDAIWLVVVEAQAGEATSPWLEPESGEPDVGGVPHHGAAIKLSFVDANPQPRLEPFNRLDTHVSYFLGSDPAGWRADVPVWGGVRYVDLYPGINLELAGEASGIVPRLVARPGADLGAVRLRVEGVDGVTLENGMLRLSSPAGDVSWPLLQAEGAAGGALVQPRGAGVFEVVSPLEPAATDAVTAPADDPSDLLYGTFLGGSFMEFEAGFAVDESGAVYIAGTTDSYDFPTTPGAFDTSFNGYVGDLTDAFVVKLNAAGSALDYATFLGGDEYDWSNEIAIDGTGAVYVTGGTNSYDFPTTPGAFDAYFNGYYGYFDAFVVKLNAAGSALVYSTFLGGSYGEAANGLAVDGIGAAYVTGGTYSSDFPTTPGAFDTSISGGEGMTDTFVVKLNAAGSALEYATYLGGISSEWGRAIALDGSGAALITGDTKSTDFPTTLGAFDPTFNESEYGYGDAFVTELNAEGSALVYSTFLGGNNGDGGDGLAVDGSGAAFIIGYTCSADFPTTLGAFDTTFNQSDYGDAFVAKLNAAGSALAYSTFLGGSNYDGGGDIAVDASGSAYATGSTISTDFPVTEGAFDTTFNSGDYWDNFVLRLNPTGSALDYSTFLGGSDDDSGGDIVVGGSGVVYIRGSTRSIDFPTTAGAYDTSYNGLFEDTSDIYLVKLSMAPALTSIYLPLVVKVP